MSAHTCGAIVITCIDFRLQEYIDNWIKENLGSGNHDRVAWAGGVRNLENILNQIKISKRLHHISKAILINHEDCGAYGEAGTAEKHAEDLRQAATDLKTELPDVAVETYYLHLNGTFETLA